MQNKTNTKAETLAVILDRFDKEFSHIEDNLTNLKWVISEDRDVKVVLSNTIVLIFNKGKPEGYLRKHILTFDHLYHYPMTDHGYKVNVYEGYVTYDGLLDALIKELTLIIHLLLGDNPLTIIEDNRDCWVETNKKGELVHTRTNRVFKVVGNDTIFLKDGTEFLIIGENGLLPEVKMKTISKVVLPTLIDSNNHKRYLINGNVEVSKEEFEKHRLENFTDNHLRYLFKRFAKPNRKNSEFTKLYLEQGLAKFMTMVKFTNYTLDNKLVLTYFITEFKGTHKNYKGLYIALAIYKYVTQLLTVKRVDQVIDLRHTGLYEDKFGLIIPFNNGNEMIALGLFEDTPDIFAINDFDDVKTNAWKVIKLLEKNPK